jgi:hypothetical protein
MAWPQCVTHPLFQKLLRLLSYPPNTGLKSPVGLELTSYHSHISQGNRSGDLSKYSHHSSGVIRRVKLMDEGERTEVVLGTHGS